MSNSPFVSQSDNKHTLLLGSFLILIIASFFSTFTTYSNYVIYPVLVLWVPFILTSSSVLSKNEHNFVRVSFLFLMLVLVYRFIGYSALGTGEMLRNINWIMAGVISIYVLKMFSGRELSIVYIVLTIAVTVLLFTYIKTGRALLAMEEQNDAAGVANAWFGSLFMLLSGLSLIVFMQVKSWFPRIIALGVLLLTLYLNFFILQRGTNVVFTLAEIGMILVFIFKRKTLVFFFSVVVVIVAIYAYITGFYIDMFDWLADIIPSERLAIRFREISTALYYENLEASTGSLSARNRLMNVSWDTFTSSIGHFVFGAGEHYGDNTIIGHHSFFIDTLARYGIIGGAMMFVYFMKQYQIIMSYLDKKAEWALYMQCAIVFLFYVLRNFYGAVANSVANFIILVFFPMTFQIIHYHKNRSKFINQNVLS